jgi:hypothetical protein
MSQLIINGMDNINQTPNKQDTKPEDEEEQETPPSPEIQTRRLRKHDDETKKGEEMFRRVHNKHTKTTN